MMDIISTEEKAGDLRGSKLFRNNLVLLALLDDVGQAALAAVVAVVVHGHEDARAAVRALLPQAGHLVVAVHLVELEDCELHLLLVLDLLRGLVDLLLALLAATEQPM